MKASVVQLQLAYCAWLILAPRAIARYERPKLSPWCALFADVIRAAPPIERGDRDGQHYRRAIIRDATPEQPFPGEVRGKAIVVEGMVRTLSVQRLASIGAPSEICKALGCSPRVQRTAAWQRELEAALVVVA